MFIIRNKKIFVGISVLLVVLSIVSVSIFKIPIGIDFKGGSASEMSFPQGKIVEQEKFGHEIKRFAEDNGIKNIDPLIQSVGTNSYLVKTRTLTDPEHTSISSFITKQYGATEESYNSIGPSIGKELRQKAILSIILVSLGIVLFIAYSFRKVSRPVSSWRYGIIAIVTLLHDIIIPVGIFSILARNYGAEVDSLFVVALLTVLGLSVSDTIVIFDRIRENLKMSSNPTANFSEIVGQSIKQSYSRSIVTSLTVMISLLSLVFFGPESTRNFALMLTAGMFFGTYSSIFLASPLLVLTAKKLK